MNLNDLLSSEDIDPKQVLVLRHRPSEPSLNKVLPWLAAERPELFNAYQQTQGPRLELAMQKARYAVSFIGREPGKALFVGLYSINGWKEWSREELAEHPANVELRALEMREFNADDPRTTVLWFDLVLTEFYSHWKGKLVVSWPPPERSWWRRADRNEMQVLAVHEQCLLDASMPDWREIILSWEQLPILPASWKSKLSEWRAIYYIFDTSDGKGYVSSAYGAENLLGRWLNYAAHGHGGNQLLGKRKPQNFQFSILQRVSPDMEAADVIQLESSWKERRHTRQPSGLNDN